MFAFYFLFSGEDRLRNTDKSLHFRSDKAQICRICDETFDSITAHYKYVHPQSEIFVSRISDEMVRKLKRGNHPAVICDKLNPKCLNAFCYFCESDKRFRANYWIDHIRMHTGEFAYKCTVCNKYLNWSKLCCSRYAPKKIQSRYKKQNFVAYICKICNYIQISERNMQKHLKNEHQARDINGQYDQVTLLPALNSVKQPILKLHDIRVYKY